MTALNEYIRQARFLIIDDEPANVRLLELLLSASGYSQLRSTTDSREALRLFQEFQPDVVLLDLMMPHLDGFDVLEQLRGVVPPDQFVPVVVLTANIVSKVRRRALQAGARDFLTKPFDAEELELRLRNLLEARFLHLGLQREKRGLEDRVAERTSELETALEEVRASQQQAIQQERLHAFATMAGGVVHDFNNSLMVLQGFSELLLEPHALANEARARRDLQLINRAASDAAQVVTRLRHFYRPEPLADEFTSVALVELLRETAELARPRWRNDARGQGQEIELQTSAEPEVWLRGNAGELRETLLNLAFNAIDAMPAGGVLTLLARAESADLVRLEVSDTGTGMSERTRQRCLEPFFTTKGERGTGLGLAMVAGMVQRHGGTMEIESAPGAGTTFRLLLPRAASAHALHPVGQAPGHRKLRVLFAEDDASVRELMTQFLERGGHAVTAARDGSEAMDLFDPEKFDLVLTDLSMPRVNGLALAEGVKQRAPLQPVVMLTGYGEMLMPEGGPPACVDALLTKPISGGALLAALERAIGPQRNGRLAA